MRITVHFMIVERDPDASGNFTFRDGGALGRETVSFPIDNGSFPQSFTTKTNSIYVEFKYTQPKNLICKTLPPCIRFLLEFTSGYGRRMFTCFFLSVEFYNCTLNIIFKYNVNIM